MEAEVHAAARYGTGGSLFLGSDQSSLYCGLQIAKE